MRLAAYASQPNYWRHLAPIVAELEDRGLEVPTFSRDGNAWGPGLVEHFYRSKLPPLMLVASHQDAQRFTDRACVYVEHGAGQWYRTDDLEDGDRLGLGFAGGGGLEHVVLFLAPSERVADRWRARYPQAAVETVGSPALDRYFFDGALAFPGPLDLPRGQRPRIAITAHHPTFGAIPECRPAIEHYDGELERLRDACALAGRELVGHAHPRGVGRMVRRWERLGMRFEPDPDVILSTSSLLIADNTSLLYEAAAIDLPVLVLNAPWYRRDVEHGLRFWSHVPGLQCDEASELLGAVRAVLTEDAVSGSQYRARAAGYAYSFLDGHAAHRAADAILKSEGAHPMAPSEITDHMDEVIERIYLLGATDAEAALIRQADPEELARLRRLNDVALLAELTQARGDVASEAVADEAEIDADLDAQASALLDDATDDGQILEAVGQDADLAARLFRLESGRDPNSPELLADLAAIAGIDYAPPAVEVVEPPVEAPPAVEDPTPPAEPVEAQPDPEAPAEAPVEPEPAPEVVSEVEPTA